MPPINKQQIKDLTLLLLYLTSWEEKIVSDLKIRRSWKGYDFEILNELQEAGLIEGSFKAKSVALTDKGIKTAK